MAIAAIRREVAMLERVASRTQKHLQAAGVERDLAATKRSTRKHLEREADTQVTVVVVPLARVQLLLDLVIIREAEAAIEAEEGAISMTDLRQAVVPMAVEEAVTAAVEGETEVDVVDAVAAEVVEILPRLPECHRPRIASTSSPTSSRLTLPQLLSTSMW